MDYQEKGSNLEGDAREMERESDRLEGEIDEARGDWESKKHDSSIPGAAPEEATAGEDEPVGEEEAPEPGPEQGPPPEAQMGGADQEEDG